MWQNHLREGFIDQDQLERFSTKREHNQHTQVYNTIYWSSSTNYYKLGSRFKFIKGLKPKDVSKDISELAEVVSLIVQNILFTLEENSIHQCSKPENLSNVSNPHQFGTPTGNHRWHRQKEEEAPHLHTGDNKSKSWATTLSKTYPRWSKDHH
jgi:hypothetical protein